MLALTDTTTTFFLVVLLGIGATLVMDIWAFALKRLWNIPSLDYALVGRWLAHMPKGILFHQSILNTSSVRYEGVLGWLSHYLIGIIFAAGLVSVVGLDWLASPTFLPALLFGMATVVFPFFVMQPCFGFGIAASKTPKPMVARSKSLLTHSVFGAGLYLTAWVINLL